MSYQMNKSLLRDTTLSTELMLTLSLQVDFILVVLSVFKVVNIAS